MQTNRKKNLFPFILPHLLWYSAHIQCFSQVLLPELFLPSFIQISWLINPKEFIQDNFLFTIPKVLPLACTCWLQGTLYVFFYKLHPQFVLFFPKNSTTKPILLHPLIGGFFFIFPWIMLENPSQRIKKNIFFQRKQRIGENCPDSSPWLSKLRLFTCYFQGCM